MLQTVYWAEVFERAATSFNKHYQKVEINWFCWSINIERQFSYLLVLPFNSRQTSCFLIIPAKQYYVATEPHKKITGRAQEKEG